MVAGWSLRDYMKHFPSSNIMYATFVDGKDIIKPENLFELDGKEDLIKCIAYIYKSASRELKEIIHEKSDIEGELEELKKIIFKGRKTKKEIKSLKQQSQKLVDKYEKLNKDLDFVCAFCAKYFTYANPKIRRDVKLNVELLKDASEKEKYSSLVNKIWDIFSYNWTNKITKEQMQENEKQQELKEKEKLLIQEQKLAEEKAKEFAKEVDKILG